MIRLFLIADCNNYGHVSDTTCPLDKGFSRDDIVLNSPCVSERCACVLHHVDGALVSCVACIMLCVYVASVLHGSVQLDGYMIFA